MRREVDMQIDLLVEDVGSKDNKIRKMALDNLLKITEEKIDWVYDIWDIFSEKLYSNNSYQRSIGVFLLSNLAKSDYEHSVNAKMKMMKSSNMKM